MDYLIKEGYPLAAQKFASEANMQPTQDTDAIQERVEIREAIYSGDIQTAIEKINELAPQVSFLPPRFSSQKMAPHIRTHCYD